MTACRRLVCGAGREFQSIARSTIKGTKIAWVQLAWRDNKVTQPAMISSGVGLECCERQIGQFRYVHKDNLPCRQRMHCERAANDRGLLIAVVRSLMNQMTFDRKGSST